MLTISKQFLLAPPMILIYATLARDTTGNCNAMTNGVT